MNHLKVSFENLFRNKKRFALVVVHLGLAFLFWIGMFLPFLVGETIINGHVSLAFMFVNLRTMVVLMYFAMLLLYTYTVLVSSEKNAKSLFLLQAIISSIILFWGVFVVQIGDTGGKLGVGFLLELILLGLIWFTYIKENMVKTLIDKYVKTENQTTV